MDEQMDGACINIPAMGAHGSALKIDTLRETALDGIDRTASNIGTFITCITCIALPVRGAVAVSPAV